MQINKEEFKNAIVNIDYIKDNVGKVHRKAITEEVVEEIKKIVDDPEYGTEFLDAYKDFLHIYKKSRKISHHSYMSAVKFFFLVEGGNTVIDAYIKTFPDRYTAKKKKGGTKEDLYSDASRYNRSITVNEIRKLSAMPVEMIHRHTFFEMIEIQAELARSAKSEMVRHKAADTLIRELKPEKDQTINVNIEDGSKSVIEDLRLAVEKVSIAEKKFIEAGGAIAEVVKTKIIEGEVVSEQ